jgi:hypothetical protein
MIAQGFLGGRSQESGSCGCTLGTHVVEAPKPLTQAAAAHNHGMHHMLRRKKPALRCELTTTHALQNINVKPNVNWNVMIMKVIRKSSVLVVSVA